MAEDVNVAILELRCRALTQELGGINKLLEEAKREGRAETFNDHHSGDSGDSVSVSRQSVTGGAEVGESDRAM